MARELLLAQSSDWPFIMKTGTFSDYASGRIKEHISRFLELSGQLERGAGETKALKEAEAKNNLFADIDYRIYSN